MSWDEIAAWIAFAAVVGGAAWALTRRQKPLSDKDRRDFDDAGEW